MRRILSLLFCLLFTPSVWAAVSFDAATTNSDTDGGSTTSFSHVTGSCSNRIIFVAVGVNAVAPPTVSSITYAGDALSQIDGQGDGGGVRAHYLWYRVAPATGSNTVSITLSAVSDETYVSVVSYCGVNQATPLGTSAKATGTNSTPTVNVSSASGELVMDSVHAQGDATPQTLTVGGGQTQRANFCYNANCNEALLGNSDESGAGTVTMSWTLASANYWSIIAVPLKPATSRTLVAPIIFQ